MRGDVMAFEADALDPVSRSGWSVTIIGRSRLVSDPAEVSLLCRLPLVSWVPEEQVHFICIGIEIVNGQRLVSSADLPVPG